MSSHVLSEARELLAAGRPGSAFDRVFGEDVETISAEDFRDIAVFGGAMLAGIPPACLGSIRRARIAAWLPHLAETAEIRGAACLPGRAHFPVVIPGRPSDGRVLFLDVAVGGSQEQEDEITNRARLDGEALAAISDALDEVRTRHGVNTRFVVAFPDVDVTGASLGLAAAIAATSALTGWKIDERWVFTGRVGRGGGIEDVGLVPDKRALLVVERPGGWVLAPVGHEQHDAEPPWFTAGSLQAAIGRVFEGDVGAAAHRLMTAYRTALAGRHARWSPGIVHGSATLHAHAATFEDMYQPLRLRFRPGEAEDRSREGDLYLPARALLAEKKPLAISGGPGSGKTTWIRSSFRALIQDHDAFPVLITLRELARTWRGLTPTERTLDAGIAAAIREHVPDVPPAVVAWLLASDHGPRPVLLVDGWDELGPLSDELREKLATFLARHPRVLAVVTSRPFSVGLPSSTEGFAALEIQPLNEQEIRAIAERFHYATSASTPPESVESRIVEFVRQLEGSRAALELARTPLLLTMILAISRTRPLPRKRHLLFEACVEHLLAVLPREKEEGGALLAPRQYRPDSAEERMRVAAALAANAAGFVHTLDELAECLPPGFPRRPPTNTTRREAREGFLRWLAGGAGLLMINADDTLAFAHRALQEYLIARHLHATIKTPEARTREFLSRLPDRQAWEPLRIWAAMLSDRERVSLAATMRALLTTGDEGYLLTGLLLAEGLGANEFLEGWLSWFTDHMAAAWADEWTACLDAWANCPDDGRKKQLDTALASRSRSATFPEWLRLSFASGRLGFPVYLPDQRTLAGAAVRWLHHSPNDAAAIAAGRVFCGTCPLWPNEVPEIGLLHLWPNRRRLLGVRLQLAILCGASREDVLRLAAARWPGRITTRTGDEQKVRETVLKCAMDWALNLDDPLLARLADAWVTRAVADLSDELEVEGVYQHLERDVMQKGRDWLRTFRVFRYGFTDAAGEPHLYPRHKAPVELLRNNDGTWTLSWMRSALLGRQRASPTALARIWGTEVTTPWLRDFLELDLASTERHGAITVAAVRHREPPPVRTLAMACRRALDPTAEITKQEQPADDAAGEPLWYALARHLSDRSTDADRALLQRLASTTDAPAPLRWGLRYIVRGDLLFPDGSQLLLDDIADVLGVPRLPLLDPTGPLGGHLTDEIALITQTMLKVRREIPKRDFMWSDSPGIFTVVQMSDPGNREPKACPDCKVGGSYPHDSLF